MQEFLPIIHIVLSMLLIGAILLQQRGASTGSAFGGSNASFNTRRGAEKWLFIATIVLGILYFAATLSSLLLK